MVSSELSCVPNAMPARQIQGLPHVRRTQPLRTKSPTCGSTPREGTNVPRPSLTDLEPRLGVLTGRSWRTTPRPTGCAPVCKRIRFGGTTSRGLAGIDPLGQRMTLRLAALIYTASALHHWIHLQLLDALTRPLDERICLAIASSMAFLSCLFCFLEGAAEGIDLGAF